MKEKFNGYDITNIVLNEPNSIHVGIGAVSAHSDNAQLKMEIEAFLKYLKAKYN